MRRVNRLFCFSLLVLSCLAVPSPVQADESPIAFITEPEEGSLFYENEDVGFAGGVMIMEDDVNVISHKWHSSLDGNISDTRTFQTNSLSPGEHTIQYSAYLSSGERVQKNRIITIQTKEPKEEKGVCGPTLISVLAMLPLLWKRR